ncbi:MAG: cell division protein FtsA [Chloroflexota bacterium]
MRGPKIAAIDVGTTKVCTIMAAMDGDSGLRVLGVGVAPSRGMEKALVANINLTRESILESVRKAEKMAGYKLDSAYVGVTGRHINSMNNRGVIAITRTDQLVRSADLRRVMDVALNIKAPSDRKLLHVIPRTYVLDGQEVKNPVGMHGYELNVEAHVVTASVASIQNLTKCIMRLGINIEDLILEPLASAEAVLAEEEKQNGVLVADIGGGTTDIAVIKEGSIYHTSVLPVAGSQVTHDISVGLGLSFELAEEMKRKYANVTPAIEETSDKDVSLSGDGHSVSSRDLCDIVYARMEELIRLIVLELPRTDYARVIPAGIVLTGGTSNLPGLAELASEITRLPVRIGMPASLYGVSQEVLNDPAYATSVGLLLWKMKNEGAIKWPTQTSGLRRFFNQIFRLFQ